MVTRGRLAHLAIGILIPAIAKKLGGYGGLGWACVGTLIGAAAWELLTPVLGLPLHWAHLSGDVIDLVAAAAGVVLMGVVLGKPKKRGSPTR